jgi:hypothetical protein
MDALAIIHDLNCLSSLEDPLAKEIRTAAEKAFPGDLDDIISSIVTTIVQYWDDLTEGYHYDFNKDVFERAFDDESKPRYSEALNNFIDFIIEYTVEHINGL